MPAMVWDPLALSAEVSSLVEVKGTRRCSRMGAAGASGGSLTLYVAGCNLRCRHCWADQSREDPLHHSEPYAPQDVARRAKLFEREHRNLPPDHVLRLSGGEPLLSEASVAFISGVRGLIDRPMIVETNGLLMGAEPGIVKALAAIKPHAPHIRLSLKAVTPEAFEAITGAQGSACELPFKAIELMERVGLSYDLESVSLSPELMSPEERERLLSRLRDMGPGVLERLREEEITWYPEAVARMEGSLWLRSRHFPDGTLHSRPPHEMVECGLLDMYARSERRVPMSAYEDRISCDPGICSGKPCLKGTRTPVHIILDLLAAGESPSGILKAYPTLKQQDILACVSYAAFLAEEEAGVIT